MKQIVLKPIHIHVSIHQDHKRYEKNVRDVRKNAILSTAIEYARKQVGGKLYVELDFKRRLYLSV